MCIMPSHVLLGCRAQVVSVKYGSDCSKYRNFKSLHDCKIAVRDRHLTYVFVVCLDHSMKMQYCNNKNAVIHNRICSLRLKEWVWEVFFFFFKKHDNLKGI